jgi:hypothetical protein
MAHPPVTVNKDRNMKKCCSQLSPYFEKTHGILGRQMSHLPVQTNLDSFFKPALLLSKTRTNFL